MNTLEKAIIDSDNISFTFSVTEENRCYNLVFEHEAYGSGITTAVPLVHPEIVKAMIASLGRTLSHMEKNDFGGDYIFQLLDSEVAQLVANGDSCP